MDNYVVVEMQKGQNGKIATIVTAHETLNEAESKFFAIMSAAAISSVPQHGAFILHADGNVSRNEVYNHEQEGNENVD